MILDTAKALKYRLRRTWRQLRGAPVRRASQRVLVTGAAGAIGQFVCRELRARGHWVRGFDRLPMPPHVQVDEMHVGDLTCFDDVRRAVEGVDAITHLAAIADEADFPTQLLPNNILGSYHVAEAARLAGVTRLVLASSMQVVSSMIYQRQFIRVRDGVKPANHYGLAKLYLEQLGQMYARRYGWKVVALRLGWVPRDPEHLAKLAGKPEHFCRYLSATDAGRAFRCAIEVPDWRLGAFTVCYISSRSIHPRRGFDLSEARRLLDYEPQDRWPRGAVVYCKV